MPGPGPVSDPKKGENGKKIQEVKVRLTEQTAGGVYANAMLVHHSAEEFIMDFSVVVGSNGQVVSRVITSPGHMKRIVLALEDNLRRYEAVHGPIRGGAGQPPLILGFPPASGADN